MWQEAAIGSGIKDFQHVTVRKRILHGYFSWLIPLWRLASLRGEIPEGESSKHPLWPLCFFIPSSCLLPVLLRSSGFLLGYWNKIVFITILLFKERNTHHSICKIIKSLLLFYHNIDLQGWWADIFLAFYWNCIHHFLSVDLSRNYNWLSLSFAWLSFYPIVRYPFSISPVNYSPCNW